MHLLLCAGVEDSGIAFGPMEGNFLAYDVFPSVFLGLKMNHYDMLSNLSHLPVWPPLVWMLSAYTALANFHNLIFSNSYSQYPFDVRC